MPLLQRTPRGVEPTDHGRIMLDAAAAAFDSLRDGIQHIGLTNDPTVGVVLWRTGSDHRGIATANIQSVAGTVSGNFSSRQKCWVCATAI